MITEMYRFGEFSLDVVVRRLFHQGEPVTLSSKSFDILKLLVRRKGQLVTKEEIMKRVWPRHYVVENNITVRIWEIRKALSESPDDKFIETVPGSGYRFVARVREESSANSEDRADAFTSLAVLPFAVEGNHPRLNYISEGVMENLIDSLSRLPHLKVMARSTVARYRDMSCSPQEVAEELGVDGVVVGRVSQISSNVVVRVELTDGCDGSHAWGARFQRDFADLFTLQEEMSEELAAALRLKLTQDEKGRMLKRHTDNREAYNLYLKGCYYYNNKRSVHGIRKAAAFFRRAIREDPDYAAAHSGLADCHMTLAVFGLGPPRKIMPKARASALQALKIDDSLGHAHATLANVKANFEWDWEGARNEYERAIELSPNDAHTRHIYANYLAKVGRVEEAVAELKMAKELAPLSLNVNVGLGKVFYLARKYDEGIRQCFETLDIEPEFSPANGVLGLIYLQRGQFERAAAEITKVVTSSAGDYAVRGGGERRSGKQNNTASDPEALALLGRAFALGGRSGEARKILGELLDMSKARYVEPHAVALIYSALGDKDKAFEWLERAFRDKSTTLTYIKVWPALDSLRSDRRYGDLVSRMGLTP